MKTGNGSAETTSWREAERSGRAAEIWPGERTEGATARQTQELHLIHQRQSRDIMELNNLVCECVRACVQLSPIPSAVIPQSSSWIRSGKSYSLGHNLPLILHTSRIIFRKVQQQSDLLELFFFVLFCFLFETTGKAVNLHERLVIAIQWRPGRCYRVLEK